MSQTDRGLMGYATGQPPKTFSPLVDVSKIEQFARRIAQPVTYESELRKALATQHAIIILEKQIKDLGEVPVTYKEGRSDTKPDRNPFSIRVREKIPCRRSEGASGVL